MVFLQKWKGKNGINEREVDIHVKKRGIEILGSFDEGENPVPDDSDDSSARLVPFDATDPPRKSLQPSSLVGNTRITSESRDPSECQGRDDVVKDVNEMRQGDVQGDKNLKSHDAGVVGNAPVAVQRQRRARSQDESETSNQNKFLDMVIEIASGGQTKGKNSHGFAGEESELSDSSVDLSGDAPALNTQTQEKIQNKGIFFWRKKCKREKKFKQLEKIPEDTSFEKMEGTKIIFGPPKQEIKRSGVFSSTLRRKFHSKQSNVGKRRHSKPLRQNGECEQRSLEPVNRSDSASGARPADLARLKPSMQSRECEQRSLQSDNRSHSASGARPDLAQERVDSIEEDDSSFDELGEGLNSSFVKPMDGSSSLLPVPSKGDLDKMIDVTSRLLPLPSQDDFEKVMYVAAFPGKEVSLEEEERVQASTADVMMDFLFDAPEPTSGPVQSKVQSFMRSSETLERQPSVLEKIMNVVLLPEQHLPQNSPSTMGSPEPLEREPSILEEMINSLFLPEKHLPNSDLNRDEEMRPAFEQNVSSSETLELEPSIVAQMLNVVCLPDKQKQIPLSDLNAIERNMSSSEPVEREPSILAEMLNVVLLPDKHIPPPDPNGHEGINPDKSLECQPQPSMSSNEPLKREPSIFEKIIYNLLPDASSLERNESEDNFTDEKKTAMRSDEFQRMVSDCQNHCVIEPVVSDSVIGHVVSVGVSDDSLSTRNYGTKLSDVSRDDSFFAQINICSATEDAEEAMSGNRSDMNKSHKHFETGVSNSLTHSDRDILDDIFERVESSLCSVKSDKDGNLDDLRISQNNSLIDVDPPPMPDFGPWICDRPGGTDDLCKVESELKGVSNDPTLNSDTCPEPQENSDATLPLDSKLLSKAFAPPDVGTYREEGFEMILTPRKKKGRKRSKLLKKEEKIYLLADQKRESGEKGTLRDNEENLSSVSDKEQGSGEKCRLMENEENVGSVSDQKQESGGQCMSGDKEKNEGSVSGAGKSDGKKCKNEKTKKKEKKKRFLFASEGKRNES